MTNNFKGLLAGLAAMLLAVVLLAVPSMAAAQTYTLYRNVTGPGGVTGTMQIELANSTLAPNINMSGVPAELVAFNLTLNNLGAAPTTTTLTRSNLFEFYFSRDGAGAINDINFDVTPANADGYTANPVSNYATNITKGGYTVQITNVAGTASAPAPVPTMTEWGMILFGTILAGGAALYIQRRRQFV